MFIKQAIVKYLYQKRHELNRNMMYQKVKHLKILKSVLGLLPVTAFQQDHYEEALCRIHEYNAVRHPQINLILKHLYETVTDDFIRYIKGSNSSKFKARMAHRINFDRSISKAMDDYLSSVKSKLSDKDYQHYNQVIVHLQSELINFKVDTSNDTMFNAWMVVFFKSLLIRHRYSEIAAYELSVSLISELYKFVTNRDLTVRFELNIESNEDHLFA